MTRSKHLLSLIAVCNRVGNGKGNKTMVWEQMALTFLWPSNLVTVTKLSLTSLNIESDGESGWQKGWDQETSHPLKGRLPQAKHSGMIFLVRDTWSLNICRGFGRNFVTAVSNLNKGMSPTTSGSRSAGTTNKTFKVCRCLCHLLFHSLN